MDMTQSRSAVHLKFYKLTTEAQEAAVHFQEAENQSVSSAP